MAKSSQTSNSTLSFIKLTRGLVWLVYAYTVIAIVFLVLGFVLLLLGANADVPFVHFVYRIAAEFLQPFRGIFPPHQISDRSYFSAAGLFAIVMYSFFSVALHSLISYLTLKQAQYDKELERL
jgi:uncharacterized protein YggT (Ycf19 family)